MVTEMCISAANYIIEKVNEYNKNKTTLRDKIFMSSKRLQKILFFSDVLYMVENEGKSMLTDDFYAWPSGPVIPSVYKKFVQYQDGEMEPCEPDKHTSLDTQMRKVIDKVFEDTMKLDTIELIKESHVKNGPWDTIFVADSSDYRKMDKAHIYDYYKTNGAPYGRRNQRMN